VSGTGSQFPLTRLAAKRNQMIKDGVLLSNREAVNILDRRMQELLDRIDTNQAPNRVLNLYKLWKKVRELEAHGSDLETLKYKRLIDEEFEKAYHDYAAWQQMFEVLDLRRKMVESEVKVVKDIQAMLTAEDAYSLVADIFAAIVRVSTKFNLEPQVLKAIQYEFTRIIGEEPVREDGGAGRDTIDIE